MKSVFALSVLFFSIVTTAASADLVTTITRSQVVSENFITGSQSSLPIGTEVLQRFVYDTEIAKTVIDDGRARFSNALVAHEITIIGTTFSLSDPADVSIDNNSISSFDGFRTSNTDFLNDVFVNGMTITNASLAFIDNTENAFNSTDLPTGLRFEDFDTIGGQLVFENLTGNATNYSLGNFVAVPEPSGLFVLWGILSLFCFRRSVATRRAQLDSKFSTGLIAVIVVSFAQSLVNADLIANSSAQGPMRLFFVDSQTGDSVAGPILDIPGVQALAADSKGNLYGSDIINDQLVRIDKATGQTTPIGPFGFSVVRGLEFGADDSILYGYDTTSNPSLISIDTATGLGTQIGNTAILGVESIAYDNTAHLLYIVDGVNRRFLSIDPDTGVATLVSNFGGQAAISAMTFHNGELLGFDRTAQNLVRFDRVHGDFDGSFTVVGAPIPAELTGLTSGSLFAVPEPSSLGMGVLICLVAFARRRNKILND